MTKPKVNVAFIKIGTMPMAKGELKRKYQNAKIGEVIEVRWNAHEPWQKVRLDEVRDTGSQFVLMCSR